LAESKNAFSQFHNLVQRRLLFNDADLTAAEIKITVRLNPVF
jgi:hypothetical protein